MASWYGSKWWLRLVQELNKEEEDPKINFLHPSGPAWYGQPDMIQWRTLGGHGGAGPPPNSYIKVYGNTAKVLVHVQKFLKAKLKHNIAFHTTMETKLWSWTNFFQRFLLNMFMSESWRWQILMTIVEKSLFKILQSNCPTPAISTVETGNLL